MIHHILTFSLFTRKHIFQQQTAVQIICQNLNRSESEQIINQIQELTKKNDKAGDKETTVDIVVQCCWYNCYITILIVYFTEYFIPSNQLIETNNIIKMYKKCNTQYRRLSSVLEIFLVLIVKHRIYWKLLLFPWSVWTTGEVDFISELISHRISNQGY